MRITSKGQITIPQEIRETFGFYPESEIEFVVRKNEVILKKSSLPSSRGNAIIDAMRGKGSATMTTDEIMALTRGGK